MNNKLVRLLSMLLCLTLLLSIPFAASAEGKSNIVFWYHDGNPTSNPIFEELIKRFEAANPQYTVEYVPLPNDSYLQKYNTAIATNTMPDVITFRDADASAFINQGALLKIDDAFNAWSEKDLVTPACMDVVRSVAPDGGIYGIPVYITMDISWYNKKLMDEAGIAPPKTISEFLALCEQYAKPDQGAYFYSLRGGAGSLENLLDFIMTYAGDSRLFDDEGNCLLNSDKCVEGFEKYASIYWNNWTSKDSVTNSFKEMVAEFGAGTSMFINHNSSSLPNHKTNLGEGNFMNVAGPANDETGDICTKGLSFVGFSVMSGAKNPEGAIEFIKYMGSADAESYLCQMEGRIPVNTGVYDDEWYQQDPYIKVYGEIMASDKTRYITHPIWLPTWNEFRSRVEEPALQAVLLKEKTAKEALDEMAAYLTKAQKEYLASK